MFPVCPCRSSWVGRVQHPALLAEPAGLLRQKADLLEPRFDLAIWSIGFLWLFIVLAIYA